MFHILSCDTHDGHSSSPTGAPVTNSDNGIPEQLFKCCQNTSGEGFGGAGVELPFKRQRLYHVKTKHENLRHGSRDDSQQDVRSE